MAPGPFGEAKSTMQTIVISIVCHPDGRFSVDKNMMMGGGHWSTVFKTREAADGRAMQLQAEAGGPDRATIVVHDLRKTKSDNRPAA